MKKAIYTVALDLAKTPKDVFSHLIDLSAWWPEDFEGKLLNLNSEFVLKTGDVHYSRNQVIEFIPDEKLAWITLESIRKSDNFDWTGSKMIFQLIPKSSGTLLEFTYNGVVLENEYERLKQICDITLKDMFYNFFSQWEGKISQFRPEWIIHILKRQSPCFNLRRRCSVVLPGIWLPGGEEKI